MTNAKFFITLCNCGVILGSWHWAWMHPWLSQPAKLAWHWWFSQLSYTASELFSMRIQYSHSNIKLFIFTECANFAGWVMHKCNVRHFPSMNSINFVDIWSERTHRNNRRKTERMPCHTIPTQSQSKPTTTPCERRIQLKSANKN